MKPLYLLTLLLVTGTFAVCAQDSIYFNKRWQPTTPGQAAYYRTKSKSGNGWQAADHWLSGKTLMTGYYADDSFKVKQGEFTYYDTTGNVTHRIMYANGKQNGPETYYYPNGQIQMTGNNKNDQGDGEWIGYYPSGKLSAKAQYKKDKQISASFYHEDGSPDKSMTTFLQESEFPGGAPQWLRFLNKTLRYPDSAVVREIQGTVVIGFTVSAEGKAADFQVVESVNPYLDAEALRVMRLTPDWQPGIAAGIYTKTFKLQPIVFRLQ